MQTNLRTASSVHKAGASSNKRKLSETNTFMMHLVLAVFVLLFNARFYNFFEVEPELQTPVNNPKVFIFLIGMED
jgi:hypothetical protein